MNFLKVLMVAYVIIGLGVWITVARDWAFQPDSSDPQWWFCIFFGFFVGLLWPLATLLVIPWDKWPIKLEHERKALALEREKRLEEIERDLGLDE